MCLLCLILLLSFSIIALHAQETKSGPLAPVTIAAEVAYSTARACAASCISYVGPYYCPIVAPKDLKIELGCGCAPINACYCSESLGSSTTSYLHDCVSYKCSNGVDNWEAEVTSMLSLYDGYCATANVGEASASTTPAASAAGSTRAAVASAADTGAAGTATATATATSTGTAVATASPAAEADSGDEGLSKSDIIALAAGLGVGIPSLAVAVAALYFQLRRRRNPDHLEMSQAIKRTFSQRRALIPTA